jgi:hypothetical protein
LPKTIVSDAPWKQRAYQLLFFAMKVNLALRLLALAAPSSEIQPGDLPVR